MSSIDNKLIFGFSDIHVAKITDGSYATPIKILGGKSVECSFDITERKISADNEVKKNVVRVSSGAGKLGVLGLTTDEKVLLLGGENMSGGYALKANASMPSLALLFAQEKEDGGRLLHVIYNVQFKPAQIAAVSTENGEIEESIAELDFSCIEGSNGYYYYCVDTTDASIDSELVSTWFTKVNDPKVTNTVYKTK